MADLRNGCTPNGDFREAVCIDAGRVYDSCCDRDCLEDLRCFFLPETQALIDNALSVRLRSAEVLNVYIDVEPVNFNKGYYSCDLTFFFLLSFDLYTSTRGCPTVINGIASFNKKVILFGSEGNVKTYSNVFGEECVCQSNPAVRSNNMPKCVVSTVDPVPLSARICEIRDCYESVCCIPESVCEAIGGNVVTDLRNGTPTIFATIGLFSIVQLIRNVQMLIPVYDFCIPDKHCKSSIDHPCDTFSKIQFPLDDFFPPRTYEEDCSPTCSCSDTDIDE
ncbi:MAG: hypothetical protein IJD45_06175 [Clostridia bacterium]|nr:hypothetical protein [Clostridia bacterium]